MSESANGPRRNKDPLLKLARSNGATLNRDGSVALPDLSTKQKRELLGEEIGTAFDAYTRQYASFGGSDVWEIGEQKVRDIDDMLARDGTARALEGVLTLPMRGANFSFEGGLGDTGELDLIQSHFATPSEAVSSGDVGANAGPTGSCAPGFRTIIGQMSMASIYKKSYMEKRYVYDPSFGDGYSVRLNDLAWRPPATCELKRDEHTGKMDGFRQRKWWVFVNDKSKSTKERNTGYIEIPKLRSYVYIHGSHRQPLTGVSDLDVALWCHRQKMKTMFLFLTFLENQALPKLAAYGSDQPQADDNADALASMRSSAVAGFMRPPTGQKLFDVIETAGQGAQQFHQAITFFDNYMTLSCLAGFLNLPSAATLGRGSYALSESQTQFFQESRQGVLNEMMESFNRDVISPLVILNRGADAVMPRLVCEPLSQVSGQQLVSLFQAVATAPALRIPDQFCDLLAEKVAQAMDLPMDRVLQMLTDGAKIRAAKSITDSPLGATPEGQEAAKLAAMLDATFTVLGGAPAQMPDPAGIGGGIGVDGSGGGGAM